MIKRTPEPLVKAQGAGSTNLCRSCGRDFASVEAFDKHRVGRHTDAGRRCLTLAELPDSGLELDPRHRWRIILTAKERARLDTLKSARGVDGEARPRGTPTSGPSQHSSTSTVDPPNEVTE